MKLNNLKEINEDSCRFLPIKTLSVLCAFLLVLNSCRRSIDRPVTGYKYFDLKESDTAGAPMLFAVTDEEFLQYGARVAYMNNAGDTIIPFGKYAYFGTDTLVYFANVIERAGNNTYGKPIGISRDQKVLFDLVMFDNGPDPFNDELTRVIRNGKMGFADKYGRVVIPCIYDYAKWFEDGKAEVTFKAERHSDGEHMHIESDEWFTIDRRGKKIK